MLNINGAQLAREIRQAQQPDMLADWRGVVEQLLAVQDALTTLGDRLTDYYDNWIAPAPSNVVTLDADRWLEEARAATPAAP